MSAEPLHVPVKRIPYQRRELSEIEAAEFRGLFFGEGHIDLMNNGSAGGGLYPRVRLTMRDDDAAVVGWCRDLFGGALVLERRFQALCWQATGRDRIGHVVEVLSGGLIPSKKRAEVDLLREAVGLISTNGRWIPAGTNERMREIRDEMKAIRQYKGDRGVA